MSSEPQTTISTVETQAQDVRKLVSKLQEIPTVRFRENGKMVKLDESEIDLRLDSQVRDSTPEEQIHGDSTPDDQDSTPRAQFGQNRSVVKI